MRMDHARAARILITETASRADEVSVREIIVTTVMEMAADLAREGHRAARDVSEARTKDAVRDASADRTTRAASVPAAQEEAEDPMPSSHRS